MDRLLTYDEDADVVVEVVRDLWRALDGGSTDFDGRLERLEAMVPGDDSSDWTHEHGYGENAIACIVHAAETWLHDDAQLAILAALQVYEAADYAAQAAHPELDLNSPGAGRTLLTSPMVQTALAGIVADLSAATNRSHERLRERARREGEAWARTLP